MNLQKTLMLTLVLGSLALSTSMVYGQVYYVQPGDTLYNIAARYGTTMAALEQSNGLGNNQVYPGQALNITGGTGNSTSGSNYTVHSGDTLFLLAQKFGVSVETIKNSNHLSGDYLLTGQQINIPGNATSSSSNISYAVQTGDTLFVIAQRYKISVDALCAANNLSNNQAIYPNQSLTIPQKVTSKDINYDGFHLSQSDLALLARLVTAEASGEPFQGQVAVAATILNRLRDPLYPKTIPAIIYEIDNGRYQYSPVLDGRINESANASAYKAVQLACSGWDPSHGANGFYNPTKTSNQWVKSQTVTATIGNHIFFES